MKIRVIWIGVVVITSMIAGCTTTMTDSLNIMPENIIPEVRTDEEQIAAVLKDVQEGMETKRIFKVLAHVSKNYADTEGRDYDALKEYLNGIMSEYRTIQIRRIQPKILVHGDRARAVESFGTMAQPNDAIRIPPLNVQGQLSIYFERVDGVWQIVEWGPLW